VAAEEEELADTVSSPIKRRYTKMVNSESSNPGTKRRLDMDND
jgi:hypothetical protein